MRVRITLSEDGKVDAEGVRLEPLKEGVLRAHWPGTGEPEQSVALP